MTLPFTHDQFLDVFAVYNRQVGPVAVSLWMLTLGTLIYLWRVGPRGSRWIAMLLAIHWAWSAVGYHLAFFRRVNPAATIFAALFLVQALLFLWQGVLRGKLVFAPSPSAWGVLGGAFVFYSLAYPVLGLWFGLSYPRVPTFGVPCPTAILTAGLLLMAHGRQARPFTIILLFWAAVAGSAAFLLDIRADLALPLAGAGLLVHALRAEMR